MATTSKEKSIETKTIAEHRSAKRHGKLGLPPHYRVEGYDYFFPIDTPERVGGLEAQGYSIVDPKAERNKNLALFYGCVGANKIQRKGDSGLPHVLMEIPIEQKAIIDELKKQEANDLEENIKAKIETNPDLFTF